MIAIPRLHDIAKMALLYEKMAMEMAEDLNKIAQIVGEGEFINADWIFEQYERKASGPTVFERILIRDGCTTEEECAKNNGKDIFIGAMLRTIKERRYVVHSRWLEDNGVQICDNCGEEHEWADYRASWCDCCGARMDLDEKGGDSE